VDIPEFYLNHISASAENAGDIIRLRYKDLLRAGLSPSEAKLVADPDNENHVERQIYLLDEFPERYLGAIALKSDRMVGYSNISEWTLSDQLPFCGFVEQLAMRAMIKCGYNRSLEHPLGIQELVVDKVHGRKEIIDVLVDRAIQIAETSEIRTAQYDDRTVFSSLQDNSFVPTKGRKDLPNGLRRLYIRPYPAPEPDYGYNKGIAKIWH